MNNSRTMTQTLGLKFALILAFMMTFFVAGMAQIDEGGTEAADADRPVTPEVNLDDALNEVKLDLETLIDLAVRDIDQFWRAEFETLEFRYFPPTEVSGYDSPIQTACGLASPNNAFYCGRSHSIHYDVNFLGRIQERIGNFAAVAVIAHEWGHAIQAHFGFSRITILNELQADCMAGAYAQTARGSILWDNQDISDGVTLFGLIGDRGNTPWYAPGAHGSSDERSNAFDSGLNQGVRRCFVNF